MSFFIRNYRALGLNNYEKYWPISAYFSLKGGNLGICLILYILMMICLFIKAGHMDSRIFENVDAAIQLDKILLMAYF